MPDSDTAFNTQPQPRTFAPSKEDVLQNLQYFFGAPVSPEKLKDYSEHHAVTCAPPPPVTEPQSPPLSATSAPERGACAWQITSRMPTLARTRERISTASHDFHIHFHVHAYACLYPFQKDSGHSQQPHPQVAPELADFGRPAVFPDPRNGELRSN